ncbi:putative fatty acyl-CoA reductase CG5065 isoform X3 [Leguminivora glycinivorella]|uniref:putative fatty acyl-CoA reductase CG5065 isoform X3 n=1 Tax=Leguminivora glycinivorella TaxID=1035111 RepID=UPI00200EB771|nr:putative fatty acyl-CoA reductase CG5065 isoform X3 [Leguminivora glycinivorella]
MCAKFQLNRKPKMESKSSVREFYKGKNVLVTGPSGFMGKVLVEKLLYTIPDIGRVYLVLRPKWGKTVQERLEHMLSSPMFERLRKEQKGAFEKMIPIQGDVLKDDLGISNEDMKILSEEVSIVFHMAAILKMEAPLKDSVAMNTAGTQRALDVARRFKHLVMFVHVSTAFCYPEYKVLEEKFHDPPVNPSDIMRMCEWLDDKQVSLLTPSLLGQHPNTYTYTKRLAESLVYDAHPEIPCVIARPSIVCPAYADPIPGWVDNLNGPVGLIIGAGKGVIRTMLCDPSIYAQVIPVDGAINAIIALVMIEAAKNMVRVQDKISRGLELLQYFTVREWHFPCPNFEAIHNTLSEEERLVYITHKDPKEFDMWDYFHKGVETGRVICLKDDLSKIPLNRIYFKFLYVLDSVVKIVFWCFVLSFIVSWCQPLRDFLAFGEPIVRRVPFVGSAVFHK